MNPPTTMADALRTAAELHGDRPALSAPCAATTRLGTWNGVGELRTWTYRELLAWVEQTAGTLRGSVRPGERVALWAANCAEWVATFLAGGHAGIPVVIMNPGLSVAEAADLLQRSGARTIAMTASHRGAPRDPTPLERVGGQPLLLEELTGDGASPGPAAPRTAPYVREAAVIQYTSGSTGRPKAVLLAEHALLRNGRLSAQCQGATEHDVALNATPLAHVGGYAQFLLGGILTGKHMVVAGGFDPGGFLDAIEHFEVTLTGAVPTMWLSILDEQRRSPRDVSSVRTVSSGATDQPAAVVRAVRECFDARYQVFYGMTETSGAVTGTRPEDPPERSWTGVGRPLPGTEIRILDPRTSADAEPGAAGEIWVRGEGVMLGYLNDVEAGRATITPDGWLKTGDLGRLDADGYLAIVGRLKDMIIKGGENLSPVEIEESVREIQGLIDVAVIPVADDRWGEVPAAIVIGDADADLDLVAARCRERLGSFKTPTHWMRTTRLPVTPVGKVDKLALRASFRADFTVGADLSKTTI